MKMITTTASLEDVCDQFSAADFITVDTEFIRETTYWPRLCLLQMASPDAEVIIDPLAQDLDLSPFWALMKNQEVVKVFHAARQDIEIIYNMAGFVPAPIFDTQVAAMVCGFGDSVGYSMLAKKLLGRTLDKTPRSTDWSKRPLSDKQLRYALGDVTHLRKIYLRLKSELDRRNRACWLDEEMALLTAEETYDLRPEQAWRRMKYKVHNKKALAILIELAAWREQTAQQKDIPRNRILKDETLSDIANHAPQTQKELAGLRSVPQGFARSKQGLEILAAVRRGLAADLAKVPEVAKKGKPLPAEAVPVVELLRIYLKSAAADHGVAPKLIANISDLEKIAVDDNADVRALSGWRRELFGQGALDLKYGRTALLVSQGRLQLVPAGDIVGTKANDDDSEAHTVPPAKSTSH